MASAGRILIMPKGAYDSSATYEMLDLVSHNGTTWLAKKTVAGIEPSADNSEYWQNMVNMSATDYLPIAGGTLTGDTKIKKVIPQFVLEVNENRSATIQKNASDALDAGTAIIDKSDNVRTILSIQNGQLKLHKQVDGVEVGSMVVAEITG